MTKIPLAKLDSFPFERLKELVNLKEKICIVGYGLSAESHAPHFTDIIQGIWSASESNLNPFISADNYRVVSAWFNWRKQIIRKFQRAEAFQMLGKLQQDLDLTIATQCVDGLIKLNSIDGAYELYGNVFDAKCYGSGHKFSNWPSPNEEMSETTTCKICGSRCFPDVEMFGWNKKQEVRNALMDRINRSSLLILVGVDKSLAPFDDISSELLTRLPCIEILEDAIVIREGTLIHNATIKELEEELEKRLGNSIRKTGGGSMKNALHCLSHFTASNS